RRAAGTSDQAAITRGRAETPARPLRIGEADDRDRADILVRHAAEVMRQRKRRRRAALAFAGAAEQLQVVLVDHAQPRRADRMAEAFEAAVDLAGDLAVGIEEAVEHVLPAFAFGADVE